MTPPGSTSGVGQRIATARQARGWTQKQMAEALGMTSARSITNWERGRHLPRGRRVELEKLLGISLLEPPTDAVAHAPNGDVVVLYETYSDQQLDETDQALRSALAALEKVRAGRQTATR